MTDTPIKATDLGHAHLRVSSLALAAPSELRRTPATRAARAQDTVMSGHRVILSRHMGGSAVWLVSNAPTGGANQAHPDSTTWRTVAVVDVEQTAGTILVVRVASAPAGATEFFDDAEAAWLRFGVGGVTRVVADFANVDGDTATVTASFIQAPTVDEDGIEDPLKGASFAKMNHQIALVVRPDGAANVPATKIKWAENTTVRLTVQDRGGARIIHATVSEQPADHAVDHDTTTGTSCNGVHQDGGWENKIPQTKGLDGATYEEHRYGIHRALDVAARHNERLGPMIASWTPYAEDKLAVDAVESPPKVITASVFDMERVSAGTNVQWSADAVGWFAMTTGAQPHAYRQLVGGVRTFGTNAVRVRVQLRFDAPGVGIAEFRIQSSPRSWLTILPDQAVVGTTWTWFTVTGYLEANIASDDFFCIIQDFASRRSAAGNLEIRYWSVNYGAFEVA